MENKIRSFVAIDITSNLKNKFSEIQKELALLSQDVKWVEEKNQHLTLKFLGEITKDKVENVKKCLFEISQTTIPFEIFFSGIGYFPDKKHPKVIWIGVGEKDNNFIRLVEKIEDKFLKIGFEKENRQFKPHLTIGRVRSQKSIDILLRNISKYHQVYFGKMKVNEIYLMKSTLTPVGPIYDVIEKFPFTDQP